MSRTSSSSSSLTASGSPVQRSGSHRAGSRSTSRSQLEQVPEVMRYRLPAGRPLEKCGSASGRDAPFRVSRRRPISAREEYRKRRTPSQEPQEAYPYPRPPRTSRRFLLAEIAAERVVSRRPVGQGVTPRTTPKRACDPAGQRSILPVASSPTRGTKSTKKRGIRSSVLPLSGRATAGPEPPAIPIWKNG